MSEIRLDLSDAIELAELLTFLADWISSSQRPALADSLTAFAGPGAYNVDELHTDLHRFIFLLGLSDGEQLFGEHTT
ncbi:MAG TPA: hypothetical protein VE441_07990 [Mycobacterium sp.]|jgi:hypothetical protein|nr:hypothetical protein [Mycobacterium sp.]